MTETAKRDVLLQTAAMGEASGEALFHLRKHLIAKAGEEIARQYLISLGANHVISNWRSGRFGEVDLVMQDPIGLYIFVEVKTRIKSLPEPGFPEDGFSSIDWKKRMRVRNTALSWLSKNAHQDAPARLDALLIGYKAVSWPHRDTVDFLCEAEVIHIAAAF